MKKLIVILIVMLSSCTEEEKTEWMQVETCNYKQVTKDGKLFYTELELNASGYDLVIQNTNNVYLERGEEKVKLLQGSFHLYSDCCDYFIRTTAYTETILEGDKLFVLK